MRFSIVNLGCKVNRVEADSLEAALLAAGYELADEASADIIIINTCTVTGEADKKSRKAVHHALAVNDKAQVLVTGCAAAIAPEMFSSLGPRVEVVGKGELVKRFDTAGEDDRPVAFGDDFRQRASIKIQDGCNHACTYCIVHVARGPERSVASESIVGQALALQCAGAHEIVLSGINLGNYRADGLDLAGLVQLLLMRTETVDDEGLALRYRLSSIEPLNVSDQLIALLADADGAVCRHVHIPLQSGSSKVLSEMGRPYDAGQFLALVEKLRTAVPQISLSTDVIVGFPGETDDDFAETLSVVRACGFSRLHVFPYSRRKGTPAAERADQIEDEVKAARAAQLRKLGAELRNADFEGRIGTTEYVLVESERATTESYHVVKAPQGASVGSLVPVSLTGCMKCD